MSWSFYKVGNPATVLVEARKDLAHYKCAEPEEAIKAKVLEILEISLSKFPADLPVKVQASGSQSTKESSQEAANNLSFTIEPLYGFVA